MIGCIVVSTENPGNYCIRMNVGSLLSWLVPHLGEGTSGKGSQPKKEVNMRNRIKPSQRPGRSQSEFKVQEFNNPDLGSNPEAIIAMTKDFIAGQFPTNTEISLMATFIWLDGNVKILQPTALEDPDAVHNYLKRSRSPRTNTDHLCRPGLLRSVDQHQYATRFRQAPPGFARGPSRHYRGGTPELRVGRLS